MSRKLIILVAMTAVAALALTGCSLGRAAPSGHLVFEREADGNTDVYAMDVKTGEMTRLTDDPGWDGTPAWSPDGTQIVFASQRDGSGTPVVYIMNADGSDQRPLTETTYSSYMPAWSPDGARIAFASTKGYEVQQQGGRQEVNAGFELWVMDADGSNLTRVTGDTDTQSLYPSWSPDSGRLAYMQVGDNQVRILTQAPDPDSPASILTGGLTGRHWTPAWSPAGDQIAIMAEIDGVNDIWLISPEGGDATNLTNQASGDGEPAWSPDGNYLAFVSDRDGVRSLYLLDLKKHTVTRLTEDGANYARPNWTGS
jgi:Tol biopolymer transport system component